MLAALALLSSVLVPDIEPIRRDAWGVPHIRAVSAKEAWFYSGYATAQDRLWQMEMSRRVAEGRLCEVFGTKYVAADAETIRLGYTRADMLGQFRRLKPGAREALDDYARGVNAWIDEARRRKELPGGYGAMHFEPRPWENVDSVAIAVSLFQRFGKGASGQLRNLAALQYLKAQPGISGRALDAFDDLGWINDPAAPTTVLPEDQPARDENVFPAITRAQTQSQLAALPDLSLMELLPALRALDKPTATLVAESLGSPFKVGSYAMVVSPFRSTTGRALLLSGPQMGFTAPSVVHEIAIKAPGIEVTGMDVPGVPGVLVGSTPEFAWGLTSGIADSDDVFVFDRSGPARYLVDGKVVDVEKVAMELPVAGAGIQNFEQLRTKYGPVVLATKSHFFVRRSTYWRREMKAYESLLDLYSAKRPSQIERAIRPAPMSFNFFYATTSGQTGYLYIGDVPLRAPGIDPRFPTPAGAGNDWRGMVPKAQMPRVRNPKVGLITNWNNKPARWWPNQDTPVWGEIDHVLGIRLSLTGPKLSVEDLRLATQRIATLDETWPFFAQYMQRVPAENKLVAFEGTTTSTMWPLYRAWLDALRRRLFVSKLGGLMSEELFRTAIQPTLILRALQGRTKIDYLVGRPVDQVVQEAAADAATTTLTRRIDEIPVPGGTAIPFRNRGTFIQIVELTSPPTVSTILPIGESESGAHQADQADLARVFQLKPMPWGVPRAKG